MAGYMDRQRHVDAGLCANLLYPLGFRAPMYCTRKAEPGSEQCRICNAAQRRGKQRADEGHRERMNQLNRQEARRTAQSRVLVEAIAWAESERGQPDTELYRAVVALKALA